jgi:protein ImuA
MRKPVHSHATTPTIEALAEQVRRIEGARRADAQAVISSGLPALDALLPDGGFRPGSLVEWLAEDSGSGAATLALLAARQAACDGGALVVVDRQRLFYPPAAVRLKIDLQRLMIVRPAGRRDHAWALDQVLRSRGVAAVWCFPGEQDPHTLRRWQLAAEASGVLALMLRAASARHEPSWAELRLLVEPITEPITGPIAGPIAGPAQATLDRGRRWRVELLRCRSGHAGATVELELPGYEESHQDPDTVERGTRHETRTMHLASPLAAAKTRRHARRA